MQAKCPVLFLVLISPWLIFLTPVCAPTVLAQGQGALVMLEVSYDRATDLVSLYARQAPLNKVLHEISAQVPLPLVVLTGQLAVERISIDMHQRPLAQALQELLAGFNTAWLYTAAPAPAQQPHPPRLVKVFVLSRKAQPSLEARAPTAAPQQTGEPTDLLQALSEQQAPEVMRLAQALNASGKETEREETVAALFDILRDTIHGTDLRTYQDTLAALKELALERAVDALVPLVQDQDGERRVRLWATMGLGELGTERAVDPLIGAFDGPDADIRQAAANGLARIGAARGVDFLVRLFSIPRQDLHQTAFLALGLQGGDQGKAALQRVMTEGRLAPGTISPMLVDEVFQADRKAEKEVGSSTANR